MFQRSLRRLLLIHSPKGVNFTLSADDAITNIKNKYGSRWFGANLQYLHLSAPSKEFVPFYLASGRVQCSFTGCVTYNHSRTSSSSKTAETSTETIYTQVQELRTNFSENRTQVYGGFKYHFGHINAVLRSESTPLLMEKMPYVNTTDATINLFEQSTLGSRDAIESAVKMQVYELAKERVRSFHPSANSIDIDFESMHITIEELTPVFLPCYIVKATYDDVRYTMYVSGRHGTVGGPYLWNALLVARCSSLSVAALALLLIPNKVVAIVYASVAAIPVYVASYFGAKFLPLFRRDRNRRQRAAMRAQYAKSVGEDDAAAGDADFNFRPNPESRRQRVQQAYRSSTYWDDHAYQQRKTSSSTSSSSSGSGSFGGAGGLRMPSDPKGYYRRLGLRGDESVNEVRSAYRKIVLQQHPDVGGQNELMAEVNAAYRVLRDPKRRAEYDLL